MIAGVIKPIAPAKANMLQPVKRLRATGQKPLYASIERTLAIFDYLITIPHAGKAVRRRL